MKSPTLKDDAGHWRQRAQESRSIADQLDDPVAKKTMLEIAEAYEQLAVLAERRSQTKT